MSAKLKELIRKKVKKEVKIMRINGKSYAYSGQYSWTKANAENRVEQARQLGLKIKILKKKTKGKAKRVGYPLLIQVRKMKGKYRIVKSR